MLNAQQNISTKYPALQIHRLTPYANTEAHLGKLCEVSWFCQGRFRHQEAIQYISQKGVKWF